MFSCSGMPPSLQHSNRMYGLSLITRSEISSFQETSIVSFHPESKAEFTARIFYGLFGGNVNGINNKAPILSILRRMRISLQRILSSIMRNLRRSRSVFKTEYEGLMKFSTTSKSVINMAIKKLSSPTVEYGVAYKSLFSVISLAKNGNDLADMLVTRVSFLQSRNSQKRAVLSQLKVLKRSLQVARKLLVIPKTTSVTETYSGVVIQYFGKLCFQALCFDDLDVSIKDEDSKATSGGSLFINATFRRNVTLSGHFKVRQGATLEARVSKTSEKFNVKFSVSTKIFGTSLSRILEIDQDKARIVLPAFRLHAKIEFDIEVRADISKASNWQNIYFTITGAAPEGSDISRTIERQIKDYIQATSELIRERHRNASSQINGVNSSIQKMESDKVGKFKLFKKAEMKYEEMKSRYATAITNLNTSLITFRSYRVTAFFKNIEKKLNALYPFLTCNDTCISVPVYCICQDAVNVDVNTLACQLADRKATTTVEKPLKTQCALTEYRFIPYYTGTCKRGKSRRLSGALGAIGAGVGGLVGGPIGAVVGGIIGGIFGGLFSSCSETYEVYKQVIFVNFLKYLCSS